MRTRRGPDVARGPDVVHHWARYINFLIKNEKKLHEMWLAEEKFECKCSERKSFKNLVYKLTEYRLTETILFWGLLKLLACHQGIAAL